MSLTHWPCETYPLCACALNFADMWTMTRGWTFWFWRSNVTVTMDIYGKIDWTVVWIFINLGIYVKIGSRPFDEWQQVNGIWTNVQQIHNWNIDEHNAQTQETKPTLMCNLYVDFIWMNQLAGNFNFLFRVLSRRMQRQRPKLLLTFVQIWEQDKSYDIDLK